MLDKKFVFSLDGLNTFVIYLRGAFIYLGTKHHGILLRRFIMATSLAEIRAKLAAQDNKGTGGSQGGDNGIYAHWNIAEGTTARVRFLPDAKEKNSFFWTERLMIKLPFAGIKGQPDSKPTFVQVPCVEMWGESCPILSEVRTWFKDKSLEEMGRKYWKKKSYLFQGFVRENPLSDDKAAENPIRRFVISPQIFNLVKNALMDPELENMPTDYEAGLDFNIKKTSKGGYADYSTSTWARRESALTADELEAIEKFGLYNLSDFLPKKPTDVELKIMKEMFEASVDGEAFDLERWGQYFKPAGMMNTEIRSAAAPAAVAAPKAAPKAEVANEDFDADEEDAPVVVSKPVASASAGGKNAMDILTQIRNRQKS